MIWRFVLSLFLVLVAGPVWAEESDLAIWLGNESNPSDGYFGPFTFGLRGQTDVVGFSVDATYVRLHEPGTSWKTSALDEDRLSLWTPKSGLLNWGLTVWENRMVDMYTHVGGLELQTGFEWPVTLGVFVGHASREEASGDFRGARLSVKGEIEGIEIESALMLGRIGQGSYRLSTLELAKDISQWHSTISFGVEERAFDFGGVGPKIEPADEFIFVLGWELHVLPYLD